MTTSFNVNVHDLEFMLKQIKIAEDHAGGKTLLQAIMDAYNVTAAKAAQMPAGLRTVDGRATTSSPVRKTTAPPTRSFRVCWHRCSSTNRTKATSTASRTPTTAPPGDVVDSDPRTISNLLVDQTAGNPAAVMAALQFSVFSETLLPGQVAAAANAIAVAYANRLALEDAAAAAENAEAIAAAALAQALADSPGAVAALAAANAELLAAQTALADATAASNAADAAVSRGTGRRKCRRKRPGRLDCRRDPGRRGADRRTEHAGRLCRRDEPGRCRRWSCCHCSAAAAAAALALSDATLDPGDSAAVDAALAAANRRCCRRPRRLTCWRC